MFDEEDYNEAEPYELVTVISHSRVDNLYQGGYYSSYVLRDVLGDNNVNHTQK